jgi:hemin uptake protein HemP
MSCEPNAAPVPTPADDAKLPPPPAKEHPTLSSSDLLQGHREILIRHGDETYRLRLTRNGKLILHK